MTQSAADFLNSDDAPQNAIQDMSAADFLNAPDLQIQQPTSGTGAQGESSSPQPSANNVQGLPVANPAIPETQSEQSNAKQNNFPYDNPNTEYSSILPLSKDKKTGELSFDAPELIRSPARGIVGLASRSVGNYPLETDTSDGGPSAPLSSDELQALMIASPTSAATGIDNLPQQLASLTEKGISKVNELTTNTPYSAIEDNSTNTLLMPKVVDYATNQAAQKNVAGQFYDQAAANNQAMPASDVNNFLKQAQMMAPQSEEGKAFAGVTPVTSAINKFAQFQDKPISFQGAQEIDEHLSDLIDKETDPITGQNKQAVKLSNLQDSFRDAMANGPLSDARGAWTQAMKMGDVERMVTRAQGTANPSRAMQTYANTLRSKSGKTSWWNDDELGGLAKLASPGIATPVLRTLTTGGTLAGAGLGAALGEGGGVGGEIGAMIGSGVGKGVSELSRKAATAIKVGQAQDLLNTIGKNSPRFTPTPELPPPLALPPPSVSPPSGGFNPETDYRNMPLSSNEGQTAFMKATDQGPVAAYNTGQRALSTPQDMSYDDMVKSGRILTHQPSPDFVGAPNGALAKMANPQVGNYSFGQSEGMPMTPGERRSALEAYARLVGKGKQ